MALIVEDGTARADADAYISLVYFQQYAESHGFSYEDYTDPQQEQAIRRATMWFDAVIGPRFAGFAINSTQALLLPQSGLIDRSGYSLPFDTIHLRVKWAVAEATWRELQTPYSLMPDVTTGNIKKRAKVGPIEVEYAGLVSPESRALMITAIEGIVGPLFPTTQASRFTGRAIRG